MISEGGHENRGQSPLILVKWPTANENSDLSHQAHAHRNHHHHPRDTDADRQSPMLGPLQVPRQQQAQGQQQQVQQQPQQQQQQQLQQPGDLLPPPQSGQDFTLSSVLHFLQTEWRRYERDRNEWEIERAEMRVRPRPTTLIRIYTLV